MIFALDNFKSRFPDSTFDYSIEYEPLGTGGAIALAARNLGLLNDILVANGDTWIDVERIELSKKAPLMYCIEADDVSRFGVVETVGSLVATFSEKKLSGARGLINAGVYRFGGEDLARFHEGDPFH